MESTTHETAYVIHDFNATNEDEISLKAGEPVLVLEKDDLYNDGWWQVNKLFSSSFGFILNNNSRVKMLVEK
jgi:hypothetical protein